MSTKGSFYQVPGVVYPSNSSADPNIAIDVSIPGPPLLPNEWLFGKSFDFAVTFAANMDKSNAYAAVAATGAVVLNLLKNGTQFGTITFTGKTGVFSCPQTSFAAGDVLEVVVASSADETLQHFTLSLFATRN